MQSLNLADALARVGGDRELLVELIAILRSEAQRLTGDIRTGLEKGDAQGVEAAAHALRGAVASLGASAATEAAGLLELAARGGDVSRASHLCDGLERELRQLLNDLSTVSLNAPCES